MQWFRDAESLKTFQQMKPALPPSICTSRDEMGVKIIPVVNIFAMTVLTLHLVSH